ncbi:MAG: MFS transporter [Blastocatellia bacterium]
MTDATQPTRKRFGVLALIFVSVLVNYMDRANMSVAGTALREELGLSMVQMGLVFSAFGWTYSFLQVPGGVMVDLFRTRTLYAVIMCLWSLATMAQGLAHSLAMLIGCRMAIGVFQAPSYPANNKIVTRWFPDGERATAISIYTSGQFIGLAVLAPLMVWLQTQLGWRGMILVTGGAGVFYALVMYWLYRDPPDHASVNEAELNYIREGGGYPDGVKSNANEAPRGFSWSDLREAFA